MNHTPVILAKVCEHHVLVRTLDGRAFALPCMVFSFPIANATTTMTCRQYSLRPACATTVHGVQGSSLQLGTVRANASPTNEVILL